MELELDQEKVCTACKKAKTHVDVCRMKDQTERKSIEVEFTVCGVCGNPYCNLRANVDTRVCEYCENEIYNNVKEDGTLERRLQWTEEKKKS